MTPTAPRPLEVRTPDGLRISAQDWGRRDGPEILFIHPWSASHVTWLPQVQSELADEFHMVTWDLRGHGYSDKPDTPEYYKEGARWADEVQAVMDAAGLRKPVLCGISLAALVVQDYYQAYGDARIAGIHYVACANKDDPAMSGPASATMGMMLEPELSKSIEGTVAFINALTAEPLPRDGFNLLLGSLMLTPPWVREHLLGRPAPPEEMLASLKMPVLVTHGSEDQFLRLSMSQYTADKVPGARLSVFEGQSHLVGWEDTPRFNRELGEFVRSATGA